MIKKKIIIIALLTILLTATFSSASAIETNSSEENQNIALNLPLNIPIFPSEIGINATTSQINEPIATLSGTKPIGVTVKYRLDIGKLGNWFFLKRRIGRALLFGPKYALKFLTEIPSAEINLTVECPDWCTATIDASNVNVGISNSFSVANAQVTFTIVNSSGHALELNYIKVKAEFKSKWRIKGSVNETTISFMPTYLSSISANIEMLKNKTELPISPINKTAIPIDITNYGNGDTIVNVKVENPPEKWNISTDSENITLSIGETKQINLIINPDENFENETITLKLTPRSTSDANVEDKYLQGTSVYLSINLLNGSPKKEEGGIPGELLIIVVIIATVLIIAAILLLERKKQ
jgi:hypothetical protein